MKNFLFIFLLFSFISKNAFAFEYILPRPQNEKDLRQQYRLELLQLALDKTEKEYGKATVKFSTEVMNHKRTISEIMKNTGAVTIMGTAFTNSRAEEMYLIDFEILNKINHYRISFVNKDFLKEFQASKSLDDLKKFPLCRKKDWFDGAYGPNGFKVETSGNYEGIFQMLNSGRCVWFPRGVNEIFDEYKVYKDQIPNAVIDDKIAVQYESNIMYFVSKESKEYGDRVKKGLMEAKKDGSFEALLEKKFKDDIEQAQLKKRRIFEIKNVLKE